MNDGHGGGDSSGKPMPCHADWTTRPATAIANYVKGEWQRTEMRWGSVSTAQLLIIKLWGNCSKVSIKMHRTDCQVVLVVVLVMKPQSL